MPFLRIDNTDINYVTGKDGIIEGRENLVFIHGGGGNHKAWLMQLRNFGADYNPIAIELPGHGESGGNGERDMENYMNCVLKIIKGLSLKSCFMVGHSMGGAITLSFALKYPQYLDGIILAGSGARLKVTPDILNGIKGGFEDAVKLICTLAYSDSMPKLVIEMGEKEMLKTDPEVLYDDFAACNAFDLLNDVRRIQVPALIMCGSEDKLTFPKYSHFLHESIEGSQLKIIEKAGHMIMIEKPKVFNSEIKNFILTVRTPEQRKI